jgi:hypothetical protein
MFRLMLKISAVLLATLPGASQASGRQLFPEAVGSQRVIYDAGTPWVMSSGAITAAISFTVADRSSMWVGLVIQNNSEIPVTVREEDIVASYGATSLKVWRAEELIAKEHGKANWRKFAAALTAGLNAYSAGQQGQYSTSGTFSGNVQSFGTNGSANARFSGDYTAYGTDPLARQRAIESAARQNQALMARVQRQGELDEQSLAAFIFHSQTLPPGGGVSGHVKIDLPKGPAAAKPVVVIVQTTSGDQLPFFVGVDGRYGDVERERAAQILSMAHGNSGLVDAAAAEMRETSLASDEGPAMQNAPSPNARTTAAKERGVGGADYWPARTIDERKRPASMQDTTLDAPRPAQAVATTATEVSAVDISILGKKLQPCTSDLTATCVALDIAWQLRSPAQVQEPKAGRLVIESSSSEDAPLGISWSIPAGLVAGKKIEEHGLEFPLSKTGRAKPWLSTIEAAAMRARFVESSAN